MTRGADVLRWLRRRLGGRGRGAFGAMLNGADVMWHATAVRGREELELQGRHVVPAPSPGDRMLENGSLALPVTADTPDADGEADRNPPAAAR